MAEQPGQALPDLANMWRQWLSESEKQWNAALNQAMGTEEFTQGLGRWLDVFLHMQRVMSEAMGTQLMALNLPTRTDILELGDRLGAVENRLAALEASLAGERRQRDGGPASSAGERPLRTRRAPEGPSS